MRVRAGEGGERVLEDTARVRAAMDRVKAWMLAHGADVLVHNLADGPTTERIAQYEVAVGFALPPGCERSEWSTSGSTTSRTAPWTTSASSDP
jgi:cell wall assembly regulator SMI1